MSLLLSLISTRRSRRQLLPELCDSDSAGGQHAVLETVEVLAVNRRHKTATDKTEKDTRRDVMFADSIGKLRVFVKH